MTRKELLALMGGTAAASLLAGRAFGQTEPKKEEPKKEEAKPYDPAGEMWLGKPDAPLSMLAFESLVCGFCAKFHIETMDTLKAKYVDTGKLRIQFIELPANNAAIIPAMMARSLGEGKYFPMIDLLFKEQAKWAAARSAEEFHGFMFNYARLAGMTREKYDAVIKDEALAKAIIARWEKLAGPNGVQSTPTFVVGGERIQGAVGIEAFDKVLEPMLKKLGVN
jgi:protein-disulfide isomerase